MARASSQNTALMVVLSIVVLAASLLVYDFLTEKKTAYIDPADKQLVAAGQHIYARDCASCHGANLEGEPNWRVRKANGRLPAPPHDATGHTWHHADAVLFDITKNGLVPGVTAPMGYVSDMPAYKTLLSDQDIRAVLAYIKSSWPKQALARQKEITLRQP